MAIEFIPFGLEQGNSLYQVNASEGADILGGKGAGLMWMHKQGVSVPPGFIIPTTVWSQYDKGPKGTMKEIIKALPIYLDMLKNHFGYLPLLSVRSGARVSCPGMMDTILNVGLDGGSFWVEKLGAECYTNSFHRLVTMYGSVVKGLNRQDLEQGTLADALKVYRRGANEEFPYPAPQLVNSIEAVFKSWDNERALVYRKVNSIPREWGTAVVIQAMVFGNLNDSSGTGVLFTRNPDSGECKVKGEFLVNAQGEDVVAGIRTPIPLEQMEQWNPSVYAELIHKVTELEKIKIDVQDVEFTVQDGKLYILQTRNAKRSATAAIRIALDMEKEGLISDKEAVTRVSAKQFDLAQIPKIDPLFKKVPVFVGIPACSGVVTGKPVFSSKDAINCKEKCILVTDETTPDDISGMLASVGIITMKGGLTSHAAVVARGENVPCITGVGKALEVFKEVDVVSMDGATGKIWLEAVPIKTAEKNGLIKDFSKLVMKSMNALPIITEVPVEYMEQAFLSLGSRMLNPEEAAYFVKKVTAKVDKLYVDFTVMEGAEEEFFSICKDWKAPQKVVDFLEGLTDTDLDKDGLLQKKLILVGDVESKYFSKIGMSGDLRSLILAEKEMMINSSIADPAVLKVIAWKKEHEQLQLVSVGQVVKDVKSFVSIEKALQLVKEEV